MSDTPSNQSLTHAVRGTGDLVLSLQTVVRDFVLQTAFLSFTALWPRRAEKPTRPKTVNVRKRPSPVISRLRAPGSAMQLIKNHKSPRIPTAAQYLTRRHRSATGSRDYRLYLPASCSGQPKGLILMLHGCHQTPDDFAIGTRMNVLAEKHGLALAYPAQTKRQNRGACWNWFKRRNQIRGSGEPATLAALTRHLMREFDLSRDHVFVAGLSAGGAMATILADVYPDVFAAAGVHSGLARGAAWDTLSAMAAMRHGGAPNGIIFPSTKPVAQVRRIIFHGKEDFTVNPLNAGHMVVAELGEEITASKICERTVRGREYSRSEFTDFSGAVVIELWMIQGSGHAWSGGHAAGSFTDTKGPDASAQMVRFFLTGFS